MLAYAKYHTIIPCHKLAWGNYIKYSFLKKLEKGKLDSVFAGSEEVIKISFTELQLWRIFIK